MPRTDLHPSLVTVKTNYAGAILLALSGIILAFSGIFFGVAAACGIGLVILQIVLAIVIFFRLYNDWALSRFGNLAFLIGGSCFIVSMIDARFDNWYLLSFSFLFILSAAVAILIVIGGIIIQPESRVKLNGNFFKIVLGIACLAGPLSCVEALALMEINVGFDRETPNVLQAIIRDKTEYIVKGVTYTVSISNSKLSNEPLEVNVDRDDYLSLKDGDHICVLRSNGLIGMAWFKRVNCAANATSI
jgi:hypothetical protein